MKKITLVMMALLPFLSNGQTIVGTEPQNKNVIIEHYTAIRCGYCPGGAATANSIANANPGRVMLIFVHAGSLAVPNGAGQLDFRTPFGSSLASNGGVTANPTGTINRHFFSQYSYPSGSSNLAMGVENYAAAVNIALQEPSYVNVGTTATIDLSSREITVYVEAYYTEASPLATNKMNVVLLQDKTYGYQSNGGSNYEHNHRLVHMLSGQWGTEITETSKGSLYTNTYTYTIPTDYNQVPVSLENLKIVAFVAETTREIINGTQVIPTYTNMPEFEYQIAGHTVPNEVWSGIMTPVFRVRSLGASVSSLDIEYSVNGGDVNSYNWQGSTQYGQMVEIALPEISFNLRPQNTLTINVTNEDNSPNNNFITVNFTMAVATISKNLVVSVKPDAYGSEITWNIKDQEGVIIANGGPYPNNNTTVQNHNVTIEGGNYSLNVLDSYGDGIPGGYVNLLAGATTVVGISGSSFTSSVSKKFRVVEPINLIFDPVNEAVDIDGDGPFMIVADKNLYTTTFAELTNETVAAAVRLKEGSATGTNIPFTATVSEQKIITVTPDEQIADDVVVYLGLVAKDEDNITVNQGVTFTVKNPMGINGVNNETVSVYPNPAKGYFQVTGVENGQVTVYTTSGKLVTSQTISSNNQHILLPNGTNGVLMVKIQQNDKMLVKPLVVLE